MVGGFSFFLYDSTILSIQYITVFRNGSGYIEILHIVSLFSVYLPVSLIISSFRIIHSCFIIHYRLISLSLHGALPGKTNRQVAFFAVAAAAAELMWSFLYMY